MQLAAFVFDSGIDASLLKTTDIAGDCYIDPFESSAAIACRPLIDMCARPALTIGSIFDAPPAVPSAAAALLRRRTMCRRPYLASLRTR